MNVILLHSDHRHVSATHVVIFSVVSARIQNIFIVCRDHYTDKLMYSLSKFRLNGKRVMRIKCRKIKMVVSLNYTTSTVE
jgi:hypothetical protein